MPSHFLYSTNVFLKLLIQEQFRNDVHYVWCSESFNPSKLNPYSITSMIAPSSSPFDIYNDLKVALARNDRHNDKINNQKLSFKNLADMWEASGGITKDQRDEIYYMVENATNNEWKPLIYLIPRSIIDLSRLKIVPPAKRASFGMEYIVEDLKRDEFDLIEL